MKYALGDDDLSRCVDEFSVALEGLAWRLAHRVIADEHDRRRRDLGRGARRPVRGTVAIADGGAGAGASPAAEARVAGAMTGAVTGATADAMTDAMTGAAPNESGKRTRWTRDTVIAELCEWLISGIVEPAFLRRHGKPGLVTAATRIFGRFDSALNVANLYLAKQYPDGPPAKRGAGGRDVQARAPRRVAAKPPAGEAGTAAAGTDERESHARDIRNDSRAEARAETIRQPMADKGADEPSPPAELHAEP